MKQQTIDYGVVLDRAEQVLAHLEEETRQIAHDPTIVEVDDTGDNAASLAAELREGIRFAVQSEAPEEHTESFLSNHPAISSIQAAIEENDTNLSPVDFSNVARAYLSALFRKREGFRVYQDIPSSLLQINESCKIALVGDFGTGSIGALRVASEIANHRPNHLVHMGDVYPLGSEELVQRHFIDVWKNHGPPNMFETNDNNDTRFWALNGNHEMHDQGRGYFRRILPWCRQTASYFCIQNQYWRFLGIDTAYKDHDLYPMQNEWLSHHLNAGSQANVLLSHHQLFSAYDARPRQSALPATIRETGLLSRVFAWFWGHEHACVRYEEDSDWGPCKARCIGHGGKSITRAHFASAIEPAPPVIDNFDVLRDAATGVIRNGFVLLELNGPHMHVRYIDEMGVEWRSEDWSSTA